MTLIGYSYDVWISSVRLREVMFRDFGPTMFGLLLRQ